MAPRSVARRTRQNHPPLREAPTLAPTRPATGTREDIVQAMIDVLAIETPRSTAEALKTLRRAYPDCPLALRLAALAAAMKRPPALANGIYIPK
jgi:hypothetical protein